MWPEQFRQLAARMQVALSDIALRIEHVGSTAVPGLAAKPIIDIDVVVRTPSELPEAIRRLATAGYVHEGDLGIPGREAFLWPPGESRHHLYLLVEGATELARHVAFRDALRNDASLRDKYDALKRQAAANHPSDRVAYGEAKSAFIAAALASEMPGADR